MLKLSPSVTEKPMIKNLFAAAIALASLLAFARFANRQLIREEAGECDRWATYPGFEAGEYCRGAWQARAEIDGK